SGRRGEDDDRDRALGLLLIVRVRREGRHGTLPPDLALRAGHLARGVGGAHRTVLELDGGVGEEVRVPLRVRGRTALGGHDGVLALVLDPHQRGLAQLAAPRPDRGQDDHGTPLHLVALAPVGALVGLDLVADERDGAGLIGSGECHAWILPRAPASIACRACRSPTPSSPRPSTPTPGVPCRGSTTSPTSPTTGPSSTAPSASPSTGRRCSTPSGRTPSTSCCGPSSTRAPRRTSAASCSPATARAR